MLKYTINNVIAGVNAGIYAIIIVVVIIITSPGGGA